MWLVAVVGICLVGRRCLLLTSVSTCFGQNYARIQENKGPVTAFGVLFWFCWMWLVAVVGRCLVGRRCLLLTTVSTCFGHNYSRIQENKGPVTAFGVYWSGFVGCGW